MQRKVAEFWYGIEAQDAGIVHLREAWVDPYLAGDMQGVNPTVQFEQGDMLDLGDRSLEILSVPGMTAGSIAIWEAP